MPSPRKSRPKATTERRTKAKPDSAAQVYQHPEEKLLSRPEVGTQAQFRKKKPPITYRYESSLSPSL